MVSSSGLIRAAACKATPSLCSCIFLMSCARLSAWSCHFIASINCFCSSASACPSGMWLTGFLIENVHRQLLMVVYLFSKENTISADQPPSPAPQHPPHPCEWNVHKTQAARATPLKSFTSTYLNHLSQPSMPSCSHPYPTQSTQS